MVIVRHPCFCSARISSGLAGSLLAAAWLAAEASSVRGAGVRVCGTYVFICHAIAGGFDEQGGFRS